MPAPSAVSLSMVPVPWALTAIILPGLILAQESAPAIVCCIKRPSMFVLITLLVSHRFVQPHTLFFAVLFGSRIRTAYASPSWMPCLFASKGLQPLGARSIRERKPLRVMALSASAPTITARLTSPILSIFAAAIIALALEVHAVVRVSTGP